MRTICATCGDPIYVDDEERVVEPGKVVHVLCPDPPASTGKDD